LRSDEVVGYWFDRHPWTDVSPTDVVRDLERRVAALISARGEALPGVRRVIDLLRDAGLRLALASSSSHEIICVVFATLRLDGCFEVVCSGADEVRGKPDPAVYLSTIRRLGINAADAFAIEDSAAGVESAHAAGLFVVAVPAPHDYDDPRFNRADLKLRSLDDFHPQLIDRELG
jgi:sugar-phosphatase